MTMRLLLILTAVGLLPVCFHSQLLAAPGDEYWDDRFGVPGIRGNVAALALADHELFVAGLFDAAGGVPTADLAKWDGASWFALKPGLNPELADHVLALAVSKDVLYAGGFFSEVGGVPANKIAQWDGTKWSSMGEGINGVVSTLAISGTNLYVGGDFSSAGGIEVHHIAKWNGREWADVGGGVTRTNLERYEFGNTVLEDEAGLAALFVHGNDLYVGGIFRRAGEIDAQSIAKWDGNSWSALGEGIRVNASVPSEGVVRSMCFFKGDLIVGGEFRFAGSVAATNIARWDGKQWHSMGSLFNDQPGVSALASDGNRLYAAGGFTKIGEANSWRVAAWDGIRWFSLGSGINRGGTTALAVRQGELFVGGQFTRVGNKPSTNIALWHIPQTLQVRRSGDTLALSWPAPDTNMVLEASESLAETNWIPVQTQPALQRNRLTVTEKISGAQKFYRLRQR